MTATNAAVRTAAAAVRTAAREERISREWAPLEALMPGFRAAWEEHARADGPSPCGCVLCATWPKYAGGVHRRRGRRGRSGDRRMMVYR